MKMVLTGFVDVFRREAGPLSGKAAIVTEVSGKIVEGQQGPDSQAVSASVELRMKPVILQSMPMGAPLYVIITDKKPEGIE
jgi:hypothetical protein